MQRCRGSGRMFDFVISGNQKKRPAKRILASWMLSCLAHGVALFLLIEYPELLRGPDRWDFANLWHHPKKDEQDWRLVTIIDDHFKPGPMILPSAAALKKMLSDSEKKGPGTNPPIRLNDAKAVRFNPPIKPKPPAEITAVSPSPPPNANASPDPVSAKPEAGSPGSSTGNLANIKPPLSETEPKPAVATNVAPNKIPDTIKTPPSTPSVAAKNPIVSEEGKKTSVIIPSSDDSKGFPMGDYSSRIAELLKEKYLIPSVSERVGTHHDSLLHRKGWTHHEHPDTHGFGQQNDGYGRIERRAIVRSSRSAQGISQRPLRRAG
jgi:hypothetical protein